MYFEALVNIKLNFCIVIVFKNNDQKVNDGRTHRANNKASSVGLQLIGILRGCSWLVERQ